jgi:class 3 adenylate cyclase
MTTATATRRLAAILAADVVGYSRLMGADEEGTHERFKAHLVELVDPKIREHRGRIVKTTGDGVLAEFASVVDAVRCAGEIQRAMADRDLDLAEARRLRFRIGVNLGDVIADGDDIYGDGVNIAARLKGLAVPASRHQPDLFATDNHRRQKLSPLIDRINDRYGRCAIGFGLFAPNVRAFKGHAAFHRVPERWEF